MTSEHITDRITAVAQEYVGTPEAELEILLRQAWGQAGLFDVPTRGTGRQFWRNLREDLLSRASREKESVSVMTAMVAADVVQWAGEQGIPLDHYSYPIGLLVAWVTIGALKRRNGPGDPDKTSPE